MTMPREQLLALAADVDRLLTAGASAAAGDEGLRKRARLLGELRKKVPALGQVADAVDRAARGEGPAAPALLDLLLVVRQVRASLAPAGAAGPLEPVAPTGPWETPLPLSSLYPLIDVLTGRAKHRPDALREELHRETPSDLRLLAPLLGSLADASDGLANLVADEWLPRLGPAIVPELERGLCLQGRQPDARRLRALCRLDPRRGAELCRQALAEGNTALRAEALWSLPHVAPDHAEAIALERLEGKAGKEVRAAAFAALAASRSDRALELLLAALGEPAEVWMGAAAALETLPHPEAGERLRQELRAALAEAGEARRGPPPLELHRPDSRAGRLMLVLARRGDVEGIEIICSLPYDLPSIAAITALQQVGPRAEAAVPVLVRALERPDKVMQIPAAVALAGIGPGARAAVPAMVALLGEADFNQRYYLLEALHRIGPAAREAVPALTALRDDPHAGLAAQRALAAIEAER